MIDLQQHVSQVLPYGLKGTVFRFVGLTVVVAGFPAPVGSVCRICRDDGSSLLGEVVGFQNDETIVLPYEHLSGVRLGNSVELVQSVQTVRVGENMLGRVVDGLGRFIDGRPAPVLPYCVPTNLPTVPALSRPRISEPLSTGIRAIDGLLTCGKGQRLGIFAGSGVGKSVLLGQMVQHSNADVNVVALIGERGREVREFLERDLGPEGLRRSLVVVATSDEPATVRLRAARVATAAAEFFRDRGYDVLLVMDSVTRVALAQREIGLAAGEPPATRGYPPSVFAFLPRLLERSGRNEKGSITGFYTVLVEADDENEPISDTVRGILDGHIWLSRRLANQAHWPAIDVLASISRCMNDVVTKEHREAAETIKRLLAAYRQAEDLISVGAYQQGTNPTVDLAIRLREPINRFLQQAVGETSSFEQTVERLLKLAREAQAGQSRAGATRGVGQTGAEGSTGETATGRAPVTGAATGPTTAANASGSLGGRRWP